METYIHNAVIQCILGKKKKILFLQMTGNISERGLLVTVSFSQFHCFNFQAVSQI